MSCITDLGHWNGKIIIDCMADTNIDIKQSKGGRAKGVTRGRKRRCSKGEKQGAVGGVDAEKGHAEEGLWTTEKERVCVVYAEGGLSKRKRGRLLKSTSR